MTQMINAIIVAVAVVFLLMPLLQFAWAWKRRGTLFGIHLIKTMHMQIASRGFTSLLLSSLALLILPFASIADDPIIVFFISCLWLGTALRWSTPPSLLLLGVSGSATNELLSSLAGLFPKKLAHMLLDKFEDADRGFDTKLHTIFAHSRVLGPISWEYVVKQYLHICEQVLVDLRNSSESLEVELNLIAASSDEIRGKVFYLVAQDQLDENPEAYRIYAGRLCRSLDEALRRLKRRR